MNIFKKIAASVSAFVFLLLPLFVYAKVETLDNPLDFKTLTAFLDALLALVIQIGFPFIVLFLVFIGFRFVASAGNPEELKKVRQLLFWALIGALIVLGAQALSLAISGTVKQLGSGVF